MKHKSTKAHVNVSRRVLITLLIYSVAMLSMPLTAYYLFSYLSNGSTTIGAGAAIVTVHLILAGFVHKAIKEPAAELELKEE
jgi:hypothetical protein